MADRIMVMKDGIVVEEGETIKFSMIPVRNIRAG